MMISKHSFLERPSTISLSVSIFVCKQPHWAKFFRSEIKKNVSAFMIYIFIEVEY